MKAYRKPGFSLTRDIKMIKINTSNKLENLAQGMAESLAGAHTPPMQSQQVVIQNSALQHWLKNQLCHHNHIVCHTVFKLPAEMMWDLACQLLGNVPRENAWSHEKLQWLIFAQLSKLRSEPDMKDIEQYLADDLNHNNSDEDKGVKRWQLAVRLADMFDRYAYYRPQLLRDWSAGNNIEDWQGKIWQSLCPDISQHWVGISERLQVVLQQQECASLPQRMDWFALHQLPPLFIEIIQQLGHKTDVYLWMLGPTQGYWGDLVSLKSQLKKRLESPEEAHLWETGHDLLASWGKQGQALQDLMLDQLETYEEGEFFHHPGRHSLLGQLQSDIFELNENADSRKIVLDDSIQVHNCHTAMRECQVLQEQIVKLLEQHSHLQPEDILVMVPSMGDYASYIESVFRKSDHRPYIPWNLSDLSLSDDDPLVQLFLSFIDIPNWRFTRSEILTLLDVPELRSKLQLSEDDVHMIQQYVDDAHVYWGLNAKHKGDLGLPEVHENTWRHAAQRWLLGYAMQEDSVWNDIYSGSGSSNNQALIVGKFLDLIQELTRAARLFDQPVHSQQWSQRLLSLCENLFLEKDDDQGSLQNLRDTITQFSEASEVIDEPLSADVVKSWFAQQFMKPSGHGRPYSGGITFCGMQPLRGVPFKVICLLGMQDGDFPRTWRPLEYDDMAQHWQHGDMRPGDEDRYLFLQTVLAAREHLLISYTGQDVRSNKPLQPSLMVSELLDNLQSQYFIETEGDLAQKVTRKHTLQAFTGSNFDGHNSVDSLWLEFSQMLSKNQSQQLALKTEFPNWKLSEPDESYYDMGINDLVSWLSNPAKSFLKNRINISFYDDTEILKDEEPFTLNELENYSIKNDVLNSAVDHGDDGKLSDLFKEYKGKGQLPHETLGQLVWQNVQSTVNTLVEKIEGSGFNDFYSLPISLDLTDSEDRAWHIEGQVHGFSSESHPECLVHFRPAKIKGKDVLKLWVDHLLWTIGEGSARTRTSHHIAEDKTLKLQTQWGKQEAEEFLLELIDICHRAMLGPIQVFDGASYTYARNWHNEKAGSRKKKPGTLYNAMEAALRIDNPEHELILRGLEDKIWSQGEFEELALKLFSCLEMEVKDVG